MTEAPRSPADWLIDYTSLRSLPLDQEALRIYEYAYYVGLKTEPQTDPKISFTTLLIALLDGEDETCKWFAKIAEEIGPNRALVYDEKKFNKKLFDDDKSRPTGPPNPPVLSADRELLTVSALAVLRNAEKRALQVGGSDIGVRHLIASYVLNPPPIHRAQMQRWKFQESSWRTKFFPWIAEHYTAEQWTDASYRPAPTQAVPAFEQTPKVLGGSLAFPGDNETNQILERASEFHARRGDSWLRFMTVFYAVVEAAQSDASIRTAILPLWNSIQSLGERYSAARDEFIANSASAHAAVPFSDLTLSPRVLTALETARELVAATWQNRQVEFRVGAIHLAGALISRQLDCDGDLTKLGLNPQELRLELIEHAQTQGDSGDAWREALGEEDTLQSGRPVELNSDEPEAVVRLDEDWKSDPLLIRPDVEAFAALLASTSLQPPLSIGLFGPWGSGKTTFLRRLQRAVKHRAAEAKEARAKSEPTQYVCNVVHIDFNAWHFAEDALTSSLVDTIFRELSSYIKNEEPAFGEAWTKLKQQELESTRRTLEAAEFIRTAAKEAVKNAETTLTEARKTAAELNTGLQALVGALWTSTKSSLQNSPVVKDSGVLETVGDTVHNSAELQAKLNSIRTRPAKLLNDLGWRRTLLFAAMILVLPPLVGWAVSAVIGHGGQELISAITTMLVVIGGWLRTASQAAAKVDQAVTEVAEAYESRIATDSKVQQARQNLAAAQVTATTAEVGVQAARDALVKAEAAAANATLPAQMLQLVSDRIEDKTYNKELTTLSLARADLQALSTLLHDQTKLTALAAPKSSDAAASETSDAAAAEKIPTIRPVDRVILYIDDLDRCKPADVVRVLQMVHMLLAFELFVVVVAVDARWIEESLIDSYKWLSGRKRAANIETAKNGDARQQQPIGRVTPQDYLEKIFQISFWLEPMTSARTARYLGSLVRTQTRDRDPVTGAATNGSSAARKVEIAGIELDYMRALAAYVGPSPRRVKRLVNAYRLIKARLSNAQLDKFLTREAEGEGPKSGPYQLVIGLLAIGTGAPSASTQILEEIAECDPTNTPDELVERLRSQSHPDWAMAAKVIETVMRTQKATNVAELRGWARKVGRFFLNSPTAVLRPDGQLTSPHQPPQPPPPVVPEQQVDPAQPEDQVTRVEQTETSTATKP